ncbi:MAG TPA: MBL fold metallo-hydrolase [Longimicrobiales bacterium]|nr:MBL fold metallo-hydrolase [Longimicrobiales bacterium]
MRRRLPIAVLALLAWPSLGAAQDFDAVEIRTTPIRDSIFLLQGSGGNIAVSAGADGTLMIDDQFAPLTEKIVAAIAKSTDDPVRIVVNTHWHYDHTDGNVNFGRAGALLVSHVNSRKRLTSRQVVSLNNRVQEAYDEDGLPKLTFYRSMRLHWNDNVIDIVHLPNAHTDGDAAVYFRDANVLHTGDVFTRSALPFIDQPNGGSIDGMIDAAWTLAGLIDDDTVVVPGHGPLSTRADLLAHRDKLITIRDRIRSHIEMGHSADQVVAAHPEEGYAEPGPGTERWVRAAYEELSR